MTFAHTTSQSGLRSWIDTLRSMLSGPRPRRSRARAARPRTPSDEGAPRTTVPIAMQQATAVCAQLDLPLASTMSRLIRAVHELDDLATRLRAIAPQPPASALADREGLELIDTTGGGAMPSPYTEIEAVQDRLNEALLDCDRLGGMLDNLQRLLGFRADRRQRCDINSSMSRATYLARSMLPAGIDIVERLQRVPAIRAHTPTLNQALLDAIVQTASTVDAPACLLLSSEPVDNGVRLELVARGRPAQAGQGLAVETVSHVVAQHGGTLEIEAATTEGARLTLWLPAGDD